MIFSGKSDVGKRRANNQDRFNITPFPDGAYLCTVCDGMGGMSGGNIASEIACRVYTEHVLHHYSSDKTNDSDLLSDAVTLANTAVYEAAATDESLKGMGTTLVSALIRTDATVTVINVGDSRLYSLTNGELHQITHDHSYVQYLVDMGQITVKEAKSASIRNIIIRSVGNETETNPDVFSLVAEPNSYLLLCSDGLTGCVTNDVIASAITADDQGELDRCADKLIELANEGGGTDNITVVLCKF